MKRVGNLFERVVDLDNMLLASHKAAKGKRKLRYVVKWNEDLVDNITKLQQELISSSYQVSPYSTFTIYEPKERIISRLPFRDRVLHHSIMNVLEPLITKTLVSQTYSCIKGRGIHKCFRDLQRYLKENKPLYCLKLDIRKFYPSLDHDILKEILKRKIKDPKLLYLLNIIIDSYNPGVSLGNLTSQWFANIYLNEFDHWIKQIKKATYWRYSDDMVIVGNNKLELHRLRIEIQQYLRTKLKLELSNYQVFPIAARGISFVGYRFYNSHVLLRKSIKQNFKRMLLKNPTPKSIASYNGWLGWGNCRNLKHKYLGNGN